MDPSGLDWFVSSDGRNFACLTQSEISSLGSKIKGGCFDGFDVGTCCNRGPTYNFQTSDGTAYICADDCHVYRKDAYDTMKQNQQNGITTPQWMLKDGLASKLKIIGNISLQNRSNFLGPSGITYNISDFEPPTELPIPLTGLNVSEITIEPLPGIDMNVDSNPLTPSYPVEKGLSDASFLDPIFMLFESGISTPLQALGVKESTANSIAGWTVLAGSLFAGKIGSVSRIGVTEELANAERTAEAARVMETGWKVGEPIINLTVKGNVPTWSAVRQRFWKNESFFNGSEYDLINIPRMQKGLAPQRINPTTGLLESMELHHHILPQRYGGLFDFIKVWPEEHMELDPFRR